MEKDIVFYYSREHRLSRASPAVRALNEEKFVRPGFTKTLFATKGNVFIFVSIIIVFTMFGMTSRQNARERSMKLGGNALELTILREDEIVGLRMTKTAPKSGEFYIGAVDIMVSPVIPKSREGETPQIFTHRVFFNPTDTESFYFSLPFEGDSFYVILGTDNEQKATRINAR